MTLKRDGRLDIGKSQLKIRKIAFVLVIGFILLSGCSNDNNTTVEADDVDNNYAQANDDVVGEQGEITNSEIFENFVQNVDEGTEDKTRIVRYTIEGDPILQAIEYDSENISVTNDTTRD